MQITEAETIALGDYCERLMREQSFDALCREFEWQSFQHMLGTQPHEAKRREGVYAEVTGLRAFLGLMKSYVDARDKLTQTDEQDDTDTDQCSIRHLKD